MALSEQTTESLKKAEVHLRDALAFAARVEKPYVVRELGSILSHLDNIQGTESLFDRMSTAIDRMEKDEPQ
tara:strand:- start:39 stop:251 length:213 start_codon:yes stop_codon:yes gene_type:complete